jgi:hypothetical protein
MISRGVITSVFVEEETLRVTVAQTPGGEERRIRYLTPHPSMWYIPSVGDVVTVTELADGTRVAHSPLNDTGSGIPDGLSQGDIAIKLNDNTEFILKNNGSGYDVTLSCDGELNFLANDIYVGDKNNAERVATESHTHDVDYIGDGDNATQQTATTDPPAESGLTDTEVE